MTLFRVTCLLQLLSFGIPSTRSQESVRETVPGEITPVSAEHSHIWWGRGHARYAIDRDKSTYSYVRPGDDGTTWLKVKLGQVYCIDRVIWYYHSSWDHDSTWYCSQDSEDQCTSYDKWGVFLSVYNESTTTVGNVLSTTGCRLGDTVKLYREDGYGIQLWDLVIIASLADCSALDSTWENANVEFKGPQLPVEHGTTIRLVCTAGHTNTGGNEASCQNGTIVLTDEPPLCRADCSALDSTWKDVIVTYPRLPIEHGTYSRAIRLGCTAGHTNIGSNKASCQNGKIVPTDEPPFCLGTVRETVPGEITPVLAEQTNTFMSMCPRFAIDRNMSTRSYARPGDDDTTWLKVKLGQVYCVNRVIWHHYRSTQSYHSYYCSQDECTCEDCGSYLLSVYTESTTIARNIPSTTGCRLGDTVKLYHESGGRIGVNDLVITAKLADCSALDSTWKNVVTDPQLPVEHGTAITLGCTAGHTNTGGNKALCGNGTIVLTDKPPLCLSKSCEDTVAKLERCLAKGYIPQKLENCESGAGSMPVRKTKQCAKLEGKVAKKCDYRCGPDDINECSNGSHNCSQICINEEYGYTCGCNAGYVLDSDGLTCNDINECDCGSANGEGCGGCQQNCINTIGSYHCY